MNRRICKWLAIGCLGVGLLAVAAEQATRTVTIGTRRLARSAIDRNIYGVMLEHIGQQMDTLWAELLQDVSFEGLREFSPQSERWAEGKIDNRQFWWHSGYELHPWRAFGVDQAASVRTSFATNIMHGLQSKVLVNGSDHAVGIAQDGIPLKAGMSYRFEGYLNPAARGRPAQSAQSHVTVGLYADASLQKPYAQTALHVKTAGFEKYSAVLRVPETNDNATFALTLDPKGLVAVDLVSLMPADNLSGWRADVVAAVKDMGLTSFRYPGGIFTSFIDWESMVGPRERRLPFTNQYWGGLEPNQVGTDEFLRLVELGKGEALLCVNVISGAPERAAAWVEYCNGEEGTRYGRLRARNGHPKPYGVKYWELDNEVARRYSAAQYAEQCRLYSAAMRAADPNIKIMAVAYFWSEAELELLLERAAPAIDFLAVRTVDQGELAKFQALADRYSRPEHRLLIASTEWRNRWRKDLWAPLQIEGSLRKANASWGYALECARTLHQFQRRSDHVRMAMHPSLSNLYGEDLMNMGKAGIVYSATGRVFKLMSDIRGGVVEVNVTSGVGQEKLDVMAAVDEASRRLVCTLVHGDAVEIPVRLDLRAWKQVGASATVVSLTSDRLENRSDFRTPDSIRQKETEVAGDGGIFAARLPPYSVSKVIFELR